VEHEPRLEVRQGQAARFVVDGGRVAARLGRSVPGPETAVGEWVQKGVATATI